MIYKYMNESRIKDILEMNYIRFTQPKYFNDPFELKPHIKGLASDNFLKFHSKTLEESIKKEYYTYCSLIPNITLEQFKQNIQEKQKEILENSIIKNGISQCIKDQINENLGILSLTTKKDNLLMWAHYANEHKGFVIELDKSHLFFNQHKKYKNFLGQLLKVNYSKTRPSHEFSELDTVKIFLTKSKEWEYEEEYRMFLPLINADNNSKKELFLYTIPSDAIKSIYCGWNMSEENKNLIFNIVNNNKKLNHIKIFTTKISEQYFQLDFTQIYPSITS